MIDGCVFPLRPTIAAKVFCMKNVSYYLFIFSLFFAPLAFGTVEQWSLATLEITTATAAVIFFFNVWFSKQQTVKIVGLLPLVLLLSFMILQIIPLPSYLVNMLSPGSYLVYSPLLSVQEVKSWIPLSVHWRETLQELLRFTSYALLYVLTIQLFAVPERLKNAANMVVFLAAGIALLAIIQAVGSPEKIYWLRQAPPNSKPFGPWINPNQFAGYMEMICPLALALYLFYKPRVKSQETLREKIVSFFTEPGVYRHLYLGLATVLMVLSVFVSLCRGGILSLFVAGAMFFFLYILKFPKRSRITLFVLLVSIIFVVSWFGWDVVVADFNRSFDTSGRISDGRLSLWRDVLSIIKAFPILGSGFGTFMAIYPSYKTIDDRLIYDHAHNDYLELFTDGGIIGFCLAAWFVLAVLIHGWRMTRQRRDYFAVLVGIGAMAGIAAILAHGITDFNMHNGAVGFYFFFLCGVLVASVNSRFNYFTPGSLLAKQSPGQSFGLALGTFSVLVTTFVVQLGVFLAGYHYNNIKDIYINKQLSENKIEKIIDSMQRAIVADPGEGLFSYKLASVLWFQGNKQEAFQNYVAAGIKNPLEGAFLQQIGLVLEDEEERSKKLIETGFQRALNKDSLIFSYAEWLLLKNHREEALEVLKRHLGGELVDIGKWIPLLNGYAFTHEEIVSLLPLSVESWLNFAKYCEQYRTKNEAAVYYDGALAHIANKDSIHPEWFMAVISFYQRQDDKAKLLKFIRQAIQAIPNHAPYHILLGDYYHGEGITYRAKEEYERALVIDPANGQVKSKLRRMGYGDSY